jgi:DNA-3-methyladenine glycosylase I
MVNWCFSKAVGMKTRCAWVAENPLLEAYHDNEWGVPVHDDTRLFEMLILEGAQAGLSWMTILRKRMNYRHAFDAFDPVKVARYDAAKIARLVENADIVRNRRKIEATVTNAQLFLAVCREFESFDQYIWQFVDGQPITNHWRTQTEIPTESAESRAMSKDMKQRGFKFVGPTICYAFMQACGLVNDHTIDCFRHRLVAIPMS